MPYFHATYRDRVPSIMAHGLGGVVTEQNFPGCPTEPHLAADPLLAVGFLIEHMLETASWAESPRAWLARMVVIVIDDARVDPKRLVPDDAVAQDGYWRHRGVIDATNCVVVDAAALAPQEQV